MEALEAVKEEEEGVSPEEEENTKVDVNVVSGRMLTMAGIFDICTETAEV